MPFPGFHSITVVQLTGGFFRSLIDTFFGPVLLLFAQLHIPEIPWQLPITIANFRHGFIKIRNSLNGLIHRRE